MLVGRTLIKSNTPYYCAGFTRSGSSVAVTIEVLALGSGGSVRVALEHKNSEDTAWSVLTWFPPLSSLGSETVVATDPREMLRLQYDVGGASASSFVHLQVYPVRWKP